MKAVTLVGSIAGVELIPELTLSFIIRLGSMAGILARPNIEDDVVAGNGNCMDCSGCVKPVKIKRGKF